MKRIPKYNSETNLQIQVADYLRLQYPDVMFHSDFGSGIKLTIGQAAKQKRQNGGRRAWPDMFIAEPSYEEIEIWKDIAGYEGLYMISDHGRIRRIDKEKSPLINPKTNPHNGYKYAHLSKNGKVKAFRLHRLVATHFLPETENKQLVNHIDGNKTNNKYDNLEWATPSENQLHRYRVLGRTNGGRPSKKVKCIETGEIFNSIADATRKTGIGHIKDVVSGERKTAGGLTWQEL